MNYGLIIPKIETKEEGINYILGSSAIEGEVINPSGDWLPYLPEGELQNKGFFEPYACTTFATNNAKETLINFLTGKKDNSSDRALAIASNTDPSKGGNDPHKVAECARKELGFVPEEVLPFDDTIKTLDQFYSPNPLPQEIVKKGNEFFNEYEFKHEWIWTPNQKLSPSEKRLLLQEALTKGTVCVSVYAWLKNEKGLYYKPQGVQDTHWCQLGSANSLLPYKIADSYAEADNTPFIKELDPLFDFSIAKVYYLSSAQPKLNIFQEIINLLAKVVGLQAVFVAEIVKKNEMENKPIEKKSRIIDWANAIEEFENSPKEWNNPGSIRSLKGNYLKFKTYQEGFDYLCDYLTRASTGKHKAYNPEMTLLRFFEIYAPASDKNNPKNYAKFVADSLGVDIAIKIKELV